MTVIRLIFGLIVFFFLLFVFLQNADQRVNIYFFKYTFQELPLYWVIFYSFLAGSVFVVLLAIYQEIKYRVTLSKKTREIKNLRKEIKDLRRMITEEDKEIIESKEEEENEEKGEIEE